MYVGRRRCHLLEVWGTVTADFMSFDPRVNSRWLSLVSWVTQTLFLDESVPLFGPCPTHPRNRKLFLHNVRDPSRNEPVLTQSSEEHTLTERVVYMCVCVCSSNKSIDSSPLLLSMKWHFIQFMKLSDYINHCKGESDKSLFRFFFFNVSYKVTLTYLLGWNI